MRETPREVTLVLGIGNLLLADEGVGVHAARALLSEGFAPPGVEVLEVGTAILDALPSLERARHLIVMDAMKAQRDPGTVYRVPLDRCETSPRIASLHGFDLFKVLALTGRRDLPTGVVFGVEPERLEWSMDLSVPVARALPSLLAAVKMEVACICGEGTSNFYVQIP